jgi:hypothetical protein
MMGPSLTTVCSWVQKGGFLRGASAFGKISMLGSSSRELYERAEHCPVECLSEDW